MTEPSKWQALKSLALMLKIGTKNKHVKEREAQWIHALKGTKYPVLNEDFDLSSFLSFNKS